MSVLPSFERQTAKEAVAKMISPSFAACTLLTRWRVFDRGNSLCAPFFSSRTTRSWMRGRSEEHTSELQSLMRISYAVFCLKKKTNIYESQQMRASYITTHHETEERSV